MGNSVDRGLNAGGVSAVGEAGELQIGVLLAGGFVADEACEEAAVDLGQDDVHRQVGGREATVGRRPVAAARGGEGDLEDGASGDVERGPAVVGFGGEGGGVDYGDGWVCAKVCGEPIGDAGGLQAGGEGTEGREAFSAEGLDHPVDGGGVTGGQVAAVEDDEDGALGGGRAPLPIPPGREGEGAMCWHRGTRGCSGSA